MNFSHVMTYDAAVPTVYTMLTDPAFQAARAQAGKPVQAESSVVTGPDGGAVITLHRVVAVRLPGLLQQMTGDKADITEIQTWHPAPADAGVREGRLQVNLAGHSGGVDGVLRLDGEAAVTTLTVQADIKVRMPLVGGKIENFIAEMLTKFLNSDQEVGRAWLSDRSRPGRP